MDRPMTTRPMDDMSPGYTAMVPTPTVDDSPLPSLDFYGALMRRKFVVILFALIGAGMGYLLFTQATPLYSSSLRLMIWIQAPPSVINGEPVPQQVSLSKQQNLIASQLVLESAIKAGALDKLDSFQDSPYPLGTLRKMLKIVPVDKTSDALELKCEGTIPKDLPTILKQVVTAYISVIEEDTVAAGKESVQLIERLQQNLLADQSEDSAKYSALLNKLNLSAENDKGKWLNPYVDDLSKLKEERDRLGRQLRETELLIEQIKAAVDPNNKRDELQKLAVFEAKKYFQLNDDRNREFSTGNSEERMAIQRLIQRIESLDAEVLSLQGDREKALKIYEVRHPAVVGLDASIESAMQSRDRMKQELDRLYLALQDNKEIEKKTEAYALESKSKEQDMLRLYAASLLNNRDKLSSSLTAVNAEIEELDQKAKDVQVDITELNLLKEQIDDRRNSVAAILEKLSAIRVVSSNYTTTKVRVIDNATGASQVAPKLYIYLGAGVMVASLLGVGLALLIDNSDLAYRTPIDIQTSLSVPVLCKIPKIRKDKRSADFAGSPMLVTAYNSRSPASETFRALRTSLLFAAQQNSGKVYMLTSPSPGDGKSTTIANLAVSLAQTNKKVVLVDADYRRPRVQQNFGIQFEPGGTDVLSGKVRLEDALRPCDFQPNLSLLTTGGRPKDPGELVASTEFAKMVEQLRGMYDFVLIDSPPILPVADSTGLAAIVDGIFLVIRIRRGVMLSAHKAKERLDMVQANVVGVIVNGMDENVYYNEYGMYYRGSYYYGYNYGKYYESQSKDYSDKVAKESKRTVKIGT